MDLQTLQTATVAELEEIYRTDTPAEVPTGVFRGEVIQRLQTRGAKRLWMRGVMRFGFELPPFGIDFDTRRWFFFHNRLQLGHFRAEQQHSRWRPTDTIALHYDISRLPRPIRGVLYDEVKPLGPDLCLGLGGINREREDGDVFFFSLERVR